MGGLSVAAREMGMRVVAEVDVNPSAMRTFAKNFQEAEAIEGTVRSRTVLERCRTLLDGDGDGLSVFLSGPREYESPVDSARATCGATARIFKRKGGSVRRRGEGLIEDGVWV
jgi:hypothetical protein